MQDDFALKAAHPRLRDEMEEWLLLPHRLPFGASVLAARWPLIPLHALMDPFQGVPLVQHGAVARWAGKLV